VPCFAICSRNASLIKGQFGHERATRIFSRFIIIPMPTIVLVEREQQLDYEPRVPRHLVESLYNKTDCGCRRSERGHSKSG
jgi:hypothetical protein